MPATKKAVDFTNVTDGGAFRPKHKPAGDYRAKVAKVEDHQSRAGNDGWAFTIVLTTDQRATYPYHCQFDEKQAWKIRKLLVAGGIGVPKKRAMVDPNKVVGKEIGITLDDDEYEGRMKSTIVDVFPASELDADEPEEEDRPAPTTTKKREAKKRPADDDEGDDDDLDDLDLEEI